MDILSVQKGIWLKLGGLTRAEAQDLMRFIREERIPRINVVDTQIDTQNGEVYCVSGFFGGDGEVRINEWVERTKTNLKI